MHRRVDLVLDRVLDALSQDPQQDGWLLDAAAAEHLRRWFSAYTGHTEISLPELRPLLKLISVLESDGKSQPAANTLIQILRDTPRTFEILFKSQLGAATLARHTRARFSEFQDRKNRFTGPRHDAGVPQGTLPARMLIRPLDSAAMRARRR